MKLRPTHIDGLDEVLHGGVPEGHVVLIVGPPGSMKSSLAYGILHENAVRGRPGLYVSLEQSRESLLDHATGLGWPLDRTEDRLSVLDLGALRKEMDDARDADWFDVFRMYAESIKRGFPYEFLVLDSLDALAILAKFTDHRRRLFDLIRWLRSLKVTSFLIGELPRATFPRFGPGEPESFGRHKEDYLADGILYLKMEKRGDFEVQRRLRVVKMRGVPHLTSYHALVFEDGLRVTRPLG
jgi:circadian clock protein KaiC